MAKHASIVPRLEVLRSAGIALEDDYMHKLEAPRLLMLKGSSDGLVLHSPKVGDDGNTIIVVTLGWVERMVAELAHPMEAETPHDATLQRQE